MTQNCKGCYEELTSIHCALSRYGHGDICSQCGEIEAMTGDFISHCHDLFRSPAEMLSDLMDDNIGK